MVETPIWKTSYRLILSDKKPGAVEVPVAPTSQPAADGSLQGWAIIENQTDNDWNNVELSLVSGRPISFVENLYQPLYIPRARWWSRSCSPASGRRHTRREWSRRQRLRHPRWHRQPCRPVAAREGGFLSAKRAATKSGYDGQDSVLLPNANGGGDEYAAGPMDATKSISSVASATSIGELFEYTVGNVTLPRQRSAMIPIITDPIEVERVSIYNPRVLARNPLNGARVKNTTKKHLLAGPVTVLDGATYAGDAQIDNIPPGSGNGCSATVSICRCWSTPRITPPTTS